MASLSYLLGDRVDALILFKVLVTLLFVLFEFLDHIGANITVHLLDLLCYINGVFWRDIGFSFAEELLHKVGDVSASDGNVLDGTADDIALSL